MKPMLAVEAPKALTFPVYASPKLDGIRAVVKDGVLLSRSLKPIPNAHVQKLFGVRALEGLDGELTVGPANHPNVMQATTSGVMSRDGEPDVTYWIFDYWTHPTTPFSKRLYELRSGLNPGFLDCFPRVKLLEQTLIYDAERLAEYEQAQVQAGFEGVMLRSIDGPYKYGRSTAKEGTLLKVKRWTDAEAVVIGFEEGMHNANEATVNALGHTERSSHQANKVPKDTLGAFLVRGADGVEFRVSPGCLTHPQRKALWDDRSAYLGRLLTYKTFEVTGVKDKPRFNVFKAFRDTRDLS